MPDTYATYTMAMTYVGQGLRAQYDPWLEATEEEQLQALTSATRLMATLPWAGLKATIAQELHHPIAGETEIPILLQEACVEIAVKLLEGRDVEEDYQSQVASSERFGRVSVTRDTKLLQPHLIAGIPSRQAWNKIRPYLKAELGVVQIDRID